MRHGMGAVSMDATEWVLTIVGVGILVFLVTQIAAMVYRGMALAGTDAGRLYKAAKDGNSDVVGTLLHHGGDANVKSAMGVPVLHAAAERGHVEVVKRLLEHGADPNATGLNHSQSTLMTVCMDLDRVCQSHLETVRVLLDHGASAHEPWLMQQYLVQGRTDIPELLVEYGADVETEYEFNGPGHEYPKGRKLHEVVKAGRTDIVKWLLDHDVEVNKEYVQLVPDPESLAGRMLGGPDDGKTPLDFAVEYGHQHIADLLRARGGKRSTR